MTRRATTAAAARGRFVADIGISKDTAARYMEFAGSPEVAAQCGDLPGDLPGYREAGIDTRPRAADKPAPEKAPASPPRRASARRAQGERAGGDTMRGSPLAGDGRLARWLHEAERRYVARALRAHKGHVGETAAWLGISRRSLEAKMERYDLRAEGGALRAEAGLKGPRTLNPL